MFENDDDDFTPSQSSNLSSIFDPVDASGVSNASSSLSYRAPKQPKPSISRDSVDSKPNTEQKVLPEAKSTVILAKPVFLWQFENGRSKLLGKHLVAIIGHTSPELYEMLLYQTKTHIIVRLSLNKLLTFYKLPENYVSFFDSNKQFWNMNFESPQDMNSFLTFAISRECKTISQSKIYYIKENELSAGESEETEEGTDDSKNIILTKISKIGQQIFPKNDLGHKKSELSDSEESSSSNSNSDKPTANPKKSRRNQDQDRILHDPTATGNNIVQKYSSRSPINQNYPPHVPNYSALNNEVSLNNNQMALSSQNVLFPTQALHPSYSNYGMTNGMMAQNEIAVNLTEIKHKLNSVLCAHGEKNGNNDETLKSRIKCLNLKIDNLTTDLEKQTRLFEDLKIKYDEATSEIAKHEEEKNRSCKVLTNRIEELQAEFGAVKKLEDENCQLKANIKEKNDLIVSQQLKLRELEDLWIENQETKKCLEIEKEKLNLKIEKLTLEAEEFKNKENNLREKGDKKVTDKKIKETMNQAFISIMDNFNENDSYSFQEIQQVVLKNLKETTFSLMNNLE